MEAASREDFEKDKKFGPSNSCLYCFFCTRAKENNLTVYRCRSMIEDGVPGADTIIKFPEMKKCADFCEEWA